MVNGAMLLLGASCWLLAAIGSCEDLVEVGPHEEHVFKSPEEKELIEALQDVLEKLRSKQPPTTEKKLGRLPSCDAGEQCALRKGSRVGKLCGCPGGSECNFSLLKCL